jgi:hypothetical protein
MGGRVSTDISNCVLFRDVRAPRWVTCVSLGRGALASEALCLIGGGVQSENNLVRSSPIYAPI